MCARSKRLRKNAQASPRNLEPAEQTKAPIPPRSSGGFPTRSASPSLSPSVATGECCTYTSAVSISLRTWCAGWRRIRACSDQVELVMAGLVPPIHVLEGDKDGGGAG